MKDRILFFLLGVMTMIVVYGYTQTVSKSTDVPKRISSREQEYQDLKSKLDTMDTDIQDIKSSIDEIQNDTSEINDIYWGVDAIGTELVSPEGSSEGIRADVNNIKSTVYSINSMVQRMETGRQLLFKNYYSEDTGD